MVEFVVSRPAPRYLMRQPMGSEHEVDVVPGLRHAMVQSFDMVVSHASHADLHTVVIASEPTLSDHDRAVIAQALAATRRPQLTFLVESSPSGAAAGEVAEGNRPAAAAAIAVVRASQGWDEEDAMLISIDGHGQQVTARWDGRNWHCQVE